MAYATIDDVFSRYPPIATMVGTGENDVTSVEISSVYIADAESIINMYLARLYVVPVYPEAAITMIACDLAISNMLFEKLGKLPQFIQPRYDRANSMLEKLSSGSLILTSNSTSDVTSGDNYAWSTTENYHPIFSPVLGELNQTADQTYIDAELGARADDLGVGVGSC